MVKQGPKKAPLKREEFFKVRLLNGESRRWLYTQRVKFHLNNTKENEIYIEKEWKNLQNILKSATNESLGTIKRRNKRKYLKIWDDQIKQIIETKKNHKKWLISKKPKDKLEYKTDTALAKREVRRRQRLPWDKFVTSLEHETYRTKLKVYKILKQISTDVKETTRIQGNILKIYSLNTMKSYGTQQT